MRRTAVLAATLLGLAACGGGEGDDGAERCEPPPPEVPAGHRYADPYALTLPDDCIAGGLRDVPGRWFVGKPMTGFDYSYPHFEGDCSTGFRTTGFVEDHDVSDLRSRYSWSDGTRYFESRQTMIERPDEPPYEYASAVVYCMRPGDVLAAVTAYYNTDNGERLNDLPGERFGWKEPALASGLSLVGELGTGLGAAPFDGLNVVVDGTFAYVVGYTGLDIIDVSDPAQPVARGKVADEYFNDVKIVRANGRVVAYASASFDTWVIDVTAPDAPEVLAPLGFYSHSVFVEASSGSPRLYLADYTNDVPIFDVSDPRTPVMIGVARDPGPMAGIHDLFVDGDMIYVNNTTAGFTALDVSAGLASPAVERGRYPTNGYSHASWVGTAGGRRIALHGDEGMTPDGGSLLKVLDGDPASPTFLTEIGRYQSRPEVGIHNFQLVGDKVYIAYYQDGVRVVDLADPTQPREVAHYNTWGVETAPGGGFEGALGIRVAGGRIYVAERQRGLLILEEQ